MTIDELANVMTNEFAWFNMLLVIIIVVLAVAIFVIYDHNKKLHEEIWDIEKRLINVEIRSRNGF